MKSILKFLISLSLLLGLFACSSLPTEEDSSSSVKSSVQFTMQNIANSANSNILFSSTESETPSKVAISYKKSGEGEAETSTTIELTAFGSSYITDDVLSLYEGNYEVTKFDVLNDEGTTIYSTPKAGSEKAKELDITTALAYGFEVKEGEISTEKMQVVAVSDTTDPADFGHAAFTFELVDFNKFYVEVLVLDETEGWVYTTAQIDVANAEGTTIKTANIDGKMNKILVANSESYTITISKDGYASQELTFTKAKLEAYEKEAMVVKLKKAETSVLGLSDGEALYSIIVDNEGNYVVASANKIKKVSTSGKVILEKEFQEGDFPRDLIQTENGDYVICGYEYVHRYDSNFNLLWKTTISGYYNISVIENSNNELVFAEGRYGGGNAVTKLDASGNVVWNSWINQTYCLACNDIIELSNGNYLVATHELRYDDDYCAYIIDDSTGYVKTSALLTSNSNQEAPHSVTDMGDGFIFTGKRDAGNNCYFVMVKTDYNLNILWEKNYAGPTTSYVGFAASTAKTIDGNLVMLSSYGGILSLLKIDTDGNIIFQKTISNSIFNVASYFNNLKATSDGGFVFCVGDYILKFDADGNCSELENL